MLSCCSMWCTSNWTGECDRNMSHLTKDDITHGDIWPFKMLGVNTWADSALNTHKYCTLYYHIAPGTWKICAQLI